MKENIRKNKKWWKMLHIDKFLMNITSTFKLIAQMENNFFFTLPSLFFFPSFLSSFLPSFSYIPIFSHCYLQFPVLFLLFFLSFLFVPCFRTSFLFHSCYPYISFCLSFFLSFFLQLFSILFFYSFFISFFLIFTISFVLSSLFDFLSFFPAFFLPFTISLKPSCSLFLYHFFNIFLFLFSYISPVPINWTPHVTAYFTYEKNHSALLTFSFCAFWNNKKRCPSILPTLFLLAFS